MSLLMLIVPIVIPPVIAAYSVVGERDHGTLEPVLTAPVRASELLLGKAAAAFVPSVGVAYAIYFIAAISIRLGAAQVVSSVVWHRSRWRSASHSHSSSPTSPRGAWPHASSTANA